MTHRWSGWPGAWCLDCGTEDADEMALAGPPDQVSHRYSEEPHADENCTGCSRTPCKEAGSKRNDPYAAAPRST